MRNDLFLKSDVAKNLYDAVRDLPIVDYHCHLSPKEILEDREFPDIAQIWLGGDHYKWRLMRACGVPEALITGDAEPREKFRAWATCLETAMGNPLYVWSHMELSMFFGIEDTLTAESADDIFDRANAYIKEHHLSPRKLCCKAMWSLWRQRTTRQILWNTTRKLRRRRTSRCAWCPRSARTRR